MSFIIEFFDSIERSITGGRIGFEEFVGEFFEQFSDEPIIRKFISGLFYCGSKEKLTLFAVIFERNDEDRELDLFDALEDEFGELCSEMREFFGYSEEEWNDFTGQLGVIEVGKL